MIWLKEKRNIAFLFFLPSCKIVYKGDSVAGGVAVRITVDMVKEGCLLLNDVYSMTNTPIMREKTVLTKQHISVLKAFRIKEIEVARTLVDGKPFKPFHTDGSETAEDLFIRMFLKAATSYQAEFKKWQAGIPIDFTKIRKIILPLVKEIETYNPDLFSLYHYTTKDNYLYQHAVAVGLISGLLAAKLNYNHGDVLQIALAGCLADCGMAKVDPKVLMKKASLTREEFSEIRLHPVTSYQMVKETPFLKDEAKLAIYQHHERIDGSGYPHGERGNKIHPFAKIIMVADVFHAMTSERLYKKKQSPFKVLEMMMEDHFGQYDIQILQALCSSMIHFSIGERVKLSDGRIAEIMFIDHKHPARPLIKLQDSMEVIHLAKQRQLYILEVLKG